MSHFCWITTVHTDRPVKAEYALVRQSMGNEGVRFTLHLLCGHHTELERQRNDQSTLPISVRSLRPSPVPYDSDYLLAVVRELLGPEVGLEKGKRGDVWLR